ncbi:MAG: hypothetical protein ABFR75_12180 [Acidobacteriota bacterium]
MKKTIFFILLLFLLEINQFLLSSKKLNIVHKTKSAGILDKLPWKFNFEPYTSEIKHNNGKIFYYGSYHNVSLHHPQFRDIEDKWNSFKPDMAFSEGEEWPLEKSKEAAIKRYGEQGLVRYLADRDNVKIKCAEPKRRCEMSFLLKQFSPSEIKIFYVLRQIIINRDIFKKNLDVIDYVKIYLMNLSWNVPFNRSPNTVDELSICIKKLLPDLKDWTKIGEKYFMDITRPGNFLAKINVQVNKYRDKFMVKKILSALKKGKKVFFVVGKSHVFNQERRLRSIIHEL